MKSSSNNLIAKGRNPHEIVKTQNKERNNPGIKMGRGGFLLLYNLISMSSISEREREGISFLLPL
ncbi:MAG: hypothetical protein LBD15_02200 [Holosporales bacterium]|jgi:hypothetical protein|nr:hypothetical protein [Holosporales bacterium]